MGVYLMLNIVQKFSLTTVATTLISLGSIANPAMAATLYNLTDLGTLGGNTSYAYGINNRGQVVGSSLTASGNMQAFIWENGVMTGLGAFGGNASIANDINDSGQVVGYAETNIAGWGGWVKRAFVWDSQAGMQQLSSSSPTFYNTSATGINNRGEIVGYSWFYHASQSLLWENSIDPASYIVNNGNNNAIDINNSGQIIGLQLGSQLLTASSLLWDKNNTITIAGFLSNVNAINDRGQIVGKNYLNPNAFIWDKNQGIQDIDLRNAYDINNSGQVVGSSSNRAFIWENGIATDLNLLLAVTSQWQLKEAKAINNNGQIVGYGSLDGVDHAFLLTPVSEEVPEPTSILGIISFGAYCFGSRWQRKNKSSHLNNSNLN